MAAKRQTRRGKLEARDPFDLIRLLARSQNDPRKAAAELVQNALDAGAQNISITRFKKRDRRCLSIHDDGQGVFPEFPRDKALEHVATHIGFSFKRNLTPEERHRQLTLGQYGIGLLGFWSIAEELELRSRVKGSPGVLLRLHEDSPEWEIEPFQVASSDPATYTEVVLRGIHEAASRQLVPSRLAVYVGSELRGQLLMREARVVIHDRSARGRAPKRLEVEPRRIARAETIELFTSIPVAGFEHPITGEVRWVGDSGTSHLAAACRGSTVLDDLSALDGLGRGPWVDGRLDGILDFPHFSVPPGTRRGVVPDKAAAAFVDTLVALEPEVERLIEDEARKQKSALNKELLKQLQKVFASLPDDLPQYDFFEAGTGPRRGRCRKGGAVDGAFAADGAGEPSEPTADELHELERLLADLDTLPPGLLADVVVQPKRSRLLVGTSRRFRSTPLDGHGNVLDFGLSTSWTLDGVGLELDGADQRNVLVRAGDKATEATLRVSVRERDFVVEGEAQIFVVEELRSSGAGAGIPAPVLEHEPYDDWRSRFDGSQWEINRGHPDYASVDSDTTRRLRYMATLLAKELVMRNFPGFPSEQLLEKMIEVSTALDRKLTSAHVRSARLAARKQSRS